MTGYVQIIIVISKTTRQDLNANSVAPLIQQHHPARHRSGLHAHRHRTAVVPVLEQHHMKGVEALEQADQLQDRERQIDPGIGIV